MDSPGFLVESYRTRFPGLNTDLALEQASPHRGVVLPTTAEGQATSSASGLSPPPF